MDDNDISQKSDGFGIGELGRVPEPVWPEEYNRPDAHQESTGPCARCGARGSAWISGAGQFLCPRHEDAY